MMRKNQFLISIISILIVFIMFIPPMSIESKAYNYEDDCRVIVSMGDSYSSGEGLGSYYGGDLKEKEKKKDQDFLSHRSMKSWPAMLKTKADSKETMVTQRNDNWFFVAMSGAVTENITDFSELPDKITSKVYKDKKYRFKNYYNVHHLSSHIYWEVSERTPIDPQINIFNDSKLKSKEIDYITLTIGGNDAKFVDILTAVVHPDYLCRGVITDKLESIKETFPEILKKLKDTYRLISSKAGNNATIIVADYPQLFDSNGKGALVNKNEATEVNQAISELNKDVIAQAVDECKKEGLNIELVSVEKAFEGKGAYSNDAWINGYDYFIKDDDISDFNIFNKSFLSASSFHPNEKGAAKYAELINAKMDELDKKRPNKDPITVIVPDTDTPPSDDNKSEDKLDVIGTWVLDCELTNKNNDDSVDFYFGNLFYLNEMKFKNDSSFSWWIGVNGGEGFFLKKGNKIETVCTYPGSTIITESILELDKIDSTHYIKMYHDNYVTYWTRSDSSQDNNIDTTVSLEDMPITDHSSYQNNEGDSTVFNLSANGLTQCDDGRTYKRYGNVGVDGTVFNHGFEVWIARWNYKNEISWASATFYLGGKFKSLTGKTNLIKSYNTTNFDTTVYFYDGEKLLASYRLTDTDYINDISVDVTGVNELKLYVKDNIAASGGTSFALYDMFLNNESLPETKDNTNTNDPTDDKVSSIEDETKLDPSKYESHTYQVFDGVANTWEEAAAYCESLGGHLVTIGGYEENMHVYELMKDSGYSSAYIGLYESSEGIWEWCNDEAVIYTNWRKTEPNNEGRDERYGMFYYKFDDGSWNDGDFDNTVGGGKAFICEWD